MTKKQPCISQWMRGNTWLLGLLLVLYARLDQFGKLKAVIGWFNIVWLWWVLLHFIRTTGNSIAGNVICSPPYFSVVLES